MSRKPNRPSWGALGTVITVGLAEPLWVPWLTWELWRHRRTATFTYGLDDRVLEPGPLPSYGPPDDALAPLTFAEIRERCGADLDGERDTPAGAGTALHAARAPNAVQVALGAIPDRLTGRPSG